MLKVLYRVYKELNKTYYINPGSDWIELNSK